MTGFNFYLFFQFIFDGLKTFELPLAAHIIIFPLLVGASYRGMDNLKIDKFFLPIAILLFYSIITMIAAPNKFEALQRNISILITFIYLITIFYRNINAKSWISIQRALMISGAVFIVSSFVLRDTLVDYKGEFVGFSGNKHNASLNVCFYVLIITSSFFAQPSKLLKMLYLTLIVCGVWLQILTHSRIGFFILVLFLLYGAFAYTARSTGQKKVILFSLGVVIVIYMINVYYVLMANQYVSYLLERGFSGRENITSELLNYMLERPIHLLTGCGAGCLDTTGAKILEGRNPRDSLAIVGIIFEYGFIGVALLVSFFSFYIKELYAHLILQGNNNFIFLIPLCFLINPTETAAINFNSFTTVMSYVLISVLFKLNKKSKIP